MKPGEDAPKDEKPIEFKTTGKEILDPGWHVVYGQTGNENQGGGGTTNPPSGGGGGNEND